ncbi:hypothetical protein D6T65_10275 [Arthrobacter frigidicola]|nr:hypothetical protein D6T65_10275 [Arthrobacter frigidicola]
MISMDERFPGIHHAKTTWTYNIWHLNELELRSFLWTTAQGMSSWLALKEDEAHEAVSSMNPENMYGDEADSHFITEVGIYPGPYWSQLSSAVLKDTFTLLEVFLEESADGILRRHGSSLVKLSTEDSWSMSECKKFYLDYLGLSVIPEELTDLQWIRNKLTHLRDELRTKEGKDDFKTKLSRLGVEGDRRPDEEDLPLPHFEYGRELEFAKSLALSPLEAWRILNLVRAHVEDLMSVLHVVQNGRGTTQMLVALSAGRPVRNTDRKILVVPHSVESSSAGRLKSSDG